MKITRSPIYPFASVVIRDLVTLFFGKPFLPSGTSFFTFRLRGLGLLGRIALDDSDSESRSLFVSKSCSGSDSVGRGASSSSDCGGGLFTAETLMTLATIQDFKYLAHTQSLEWLTVVNVKHLPDTPFCIAVCSDRLGATFSHRMDGQP